MEGPLKPIVLNYLTTNLKNWLQRTPLRYRQHSSVKKIISFIANKSKRFVREASEFNKKPPSSVQSFEDRPEFAQNYKYFYKELKNTFSKQSKYVYEGVKTNLLSKVKGTINLRDKAVTFKSNSLKAEGNILETVKDSKAEHLDELLSEVHRARKTGQNVEVIVDKQKERLIESNEKIHKAVNEVTYRNHIDEQGSTVKPASYPSNTKQTITLQEVAKEFSDRVNAEIPDAKKETIYEHNMKKFVCADRTDTFKKYSIVQPNLHADAAFVKAQEALANKALRFTPEAKAEPASESVTLVIVNGFPKNDTKEADLFVVPSEKMEPEFSTKWESSKCLNPNCIVSACPTYLKTQMEIYQANVEKQKAASVEMNLFKDCFSEEIIDGQQCPTAVEDEDVASSETKLELLNNKPMMVIKLILNPNSLVSTDPDPTNLHVSTALSPIVQKHCSLLPFKDKPMMVMKIMLPTLQQQPPAPTMKIIKELVENGPRIQNSFLAIDVQKKKPKINFFLKFPFYCDDSCLDPNSVCKWKDNKIAPNFFTPVKEYHTSKVPVTGFCTWSSHILTFQSKESAENSSSINSHLLKWNLADTTKTKSLSGKQIVYKQMGMNQDGSKINKLIKGTKVVAKSIYTRLSKKRGEHFDDDK